MTEQLELTALSNGANALGRTSSGKVIFVAGGVSGDTVRVRITKDTASFAEGVIEEIIEPSPHRVAAACPFHAECGGCPWMCVSYEEQLRAKRDNVVSSLARIGGLGQEAAEELVAPARGSKNQLAYRNKLELAARTNKQGRFETGFHKIQSNELITPKTCPLAAKGIEKAPGALRGALNYLQGTRDLGIFRIGVRHSVRTKSTEIALWTNPGPFPRKMVADTLSSALKCTSIVRVMADPGKARKIKGVEALYGKGFWEETLLGNRYKISAPSFFQVNSQQAETMISLVMESLELNEDSIAADLYCGAGTFTLPMANLSDLVFAVESAASSVRDLRRNAETNRIGNIEVIGGDSARELPMLGDLDALVVDPPRAGLAKGVAESIAEAGPERLAYVSCNPATWARDVARLHEVGYQLTQATPVDLFPQTYHIETVSLFTQTGA